MASRGNMQQAIDWSQRDSAATLPLAKDRSSRDLDTGRPKDLAVAKSKNPCREIGLDSLEQTVTSKQALQNSQKFTIDSWQCVKLSEQWTV